VAAGKAISVAANTTVLVELDDLSAFLVGNCSITGGTGLTAHLYT
jgi:ABC-type glucose/galactose transport system permease subunit